MNTFIAYFSSMRPERVLAMCLALVALTGVADYVTGYEMNFATVYLAPISMTAWVLGRNAAIVMSIIATMAWYVSVLHM
ncbi:MAG TPA: hypothetical protein VFI62_04175, partial [Burkholderiales bacterium]|nr:hypothetical protein [Burkholderiales bacterium]